MRYDDEEVLFVVIGILGWAAALGIFYLSFIGALAYLAFSYLF